MKWVSLVPSWTETWIDLGFDVVGRTRYCIHPAELVLDIPIVGGTKDLNRKELSRLNADILLVDKEENRKEMVEGISVDLFSTHVNDLQSVPESLKLLLQGERYLLSREQRKSVKTHIDRWEKVLNIGFQFAPEDFPGVLEWVSPIDRPIDHVLYVIWKDPIMVVSQNTFIGKMLNHLGFEKKQFKFEQSYPKIKLEEIPQNTLLLFSSEPYDFQKEKEWIKKINRPAALVNGESFSWFGIRSLRFLESLQN